MTKRLSIALIALVALVLVAVLPVSATYYDINNTISNAGAVVYIGEQQLNFTPIAGALAGDNAIGWWASAADLSTTSPTVSYPLATLNLGSLYVSPAAFGNYPGNWYGVATATGKWDTNPAVFNAQDPTLAVDVWDLNTATTVTSGSVIQGDYLAFRINTNLQSALDPTKRVNDITANAAQIGNVDIKVKSASGNTYTAVFNGTGLSTTSLTKQNVTLPLWFWGTKDGNVPSAANSASNWSTGAVDATGQNAYPAGVYTVIAQSRLNGMYDNYLNGGATYTGKTVSQPATVTITSNTVSLSANVDSVVRSKPFSVTITGKPGVTYHLFIKGTSSMDGTYDNQPPVITANQAGVSLDPTTGPDFTQIGNVAYPNAVNGNYSYQNGGGKSLWSYVAHGSDYTSAGAVSAAIGNGTFLYANVTLDQTGTRTVQFSTTNWTKAQQYTIRVEQNFGGSVGYKSDEVIVQVQKGAVTIVAAGSQSYYLGEEIQFSGTNTESNDAYLFITGPNLPAIGGQIQSLDPRNAKVADGDGTTFQDVAVNGDNTWSWQWGTSSVALDAGTYTVYAVSQPEGTDNLNDVAYGTVSIIIKKPFVSATASQSTVAQGDPVYITGTAEGQPSLGVQIWILGKNFAMITSEAVNSDSSFSYELKGTDTLNMYAGQYFVVVQHPMQNGVFDVYASPALASPSTNTDTVSSYVYTAAPATGGNPTQDFALTGAGSLQGSDAAEALVQAINSPNVDDTYTKLQFLVETPVITINPVGDRAVGDKFTITATTNLAVGDNVLFTVYSSSFQPTDKTQSGEFSGASGTVAVTQGTNGLNALSFDVDASTFKPDEYLVTAQEVLQPQATGTALFNVLQAAAPTATPTPVAAVTTVPTTVATPVPTTVAPTKTPTQPGFGALVALIGLGAVALLVVRRH